MAEDIDDLLDEVESKFCKNSNVSKSSKKNTERSDINGVKGPNLRQKNESDLNSMIEDICTDEGPIYKPHSSIESKLGSSHLATRKCFSVNLGGSQNATGLSSSSVKRICDNLRCTSCDFQVVSFDNYQWHSRCEYLFFRNNIPDFSKLKVNLLHKAGSKAYACQCSWRSISQLTDVKTDPELKWVCGKHN